MSRDFELCGTSDMSSRKSLSPDLDEIWMCVDIRHSVMQDGTTFDWIQDQDEDHDLRSFGIDDFRSLGICA